MQVGDYRRDVRTVEQFAADIAKGTRAERDIVERYARYYEAKYGSHVTIEDNGCDNGGNLLSESEVTTKADYRLNGIPVEVKFNNKKLGLFHLKASQLDAYIRQGAVILWVNGYETDSPEFIALRPDRLHEIKETRPLTTFEGWGGKMCYRLRSGEFTWYPLGGKTA